MREKDAFMCSLWVNLEMYAAFQGVVNLVDESESVNFFVLAKLYESLWTIFEYLCREVVINYPIDNINSQLK